MNRKSIFTYSLFFVLLFVSVFWFACQKTGGVSPYPDLGDWVIDTVYTTPPVFSFGGSGTFHARVVDAETREPYKGQDMDVHFSATVDSSVFSDLIAYTGSDGIASTHISLNSVTDTTETLIVVTASIYRPARRFKTYTLKVRSATFRYPQEIRLTADPESTYVNDPDSIEIIAHVLDSTGNAISGILVNFERLTSNFIIPAGDYRTVNGIVRLKVAVGSTPGTARLRAWVQGPGTYQVSDTVTFRFLPIPLVTRINLSADPNNIVADGSSSTILSASVFVGNPPLPAPDGTAVRFESTDGRLLPFTYAKSGSSSKGKTDPSLRTDPFSVNDKSVMTPKSSKESQETILGYTEGGVARVRLVSSTRADSVLVTANVDTVTASISILFQAGPPATMEIYARDSSIIADNIDTTTVYALLKDRNGNSVSSGYLVNFSTDLGTVVPNTAYTSVEGIAKTLLRSATRSGLATVQAEYSSTVLNQIQIAFQSTVPRHITVQITPGSLTADGSSTASVRAQALDENYFPVTDGVPLTFAASIGDLYSASMASKVKPLFSSKSLKNDKSAKSSVFVSHTYGGWAEVTLRAGTIADTSLVSATYFTITDSLISTDTARIAFLPGPPNRITVSFSRDTLWANGIDTTIVFAQVFDVHNNPLGAGVLVTFSPSSGSVFPATSYTDLSGTARSNLTSGVSAGSFNVSATSGTAFGMSNIYYRPTLPAYINLVSSEFTIPADGTSEAELTAYVFDSDYRPISDGVRVTFETDLGSFRIASGALLRSARGESSSDKVKKSGSVLDMSSLETHETIYANTRGGSARATLVSSRETGRATIHSSIWIDSLITYAETTYVDTVDTAGMPIIDTVVVESDTIVSVLLSDTVFVDFSSGGVSRIELSSDPDTIIADGEARSKVTARVFDAHGNPLGSGIYVDFTTSSGRMLPVRASTDSTGTAFTYLYSGTTPTTATITAVSGGVSAITDVVFIGTPANSIILTLSSAFISLDGGIDTLTAYVLDSRGMPVSAGVPVDFTSRKGIITTPRVLTGSGGTAVSFLRSGSSTGLDTVIAMVGGLIADTQYVEIRSGVPNSIELSAEEDTIYADGLTST
jgi:hypothetical protein